MSTPGTDLERAIKEREQAGAELRAIVESERVAATTPEKLTPDEAKLRYWVSMGLTNAVRELRRRMGGQ